MKKKIQFLLFLVPAIGQLQSQTYIIQAGLPGSGSFVYINIKGEVIIDRKDPVSYQFSEDGVAVICNEQHSFYKLINTKGEIIKTEIKGYRPKTVDWGPADMVCRGFSSGFIVVKKNRIFGCLDTAGHIAIPFKYDNISDFNNGYGTAIADKNFYVLNKNGRETLIDIKGIIDVKHFSENFAPYTNIDDLDGFIDTNGRAVIPAQFFGVGYFSDGLAWARNSKGLIGYINKNGNWVIEPKYDGATDFETVSGLAKVKDKGKWLYIDKNGDTHVFDISEPLYDFSEGFAKGEKKNLFGFFNNKGEWVIQPQFKAVRDFKNGFAAVKIKGKWGIIDKSGNWVINPTFDDLKNVIKIN